MMIGVAESLAGCGKFDGADMANRLAQNFQPHRGYGPSANSCMMALRQGVTWNEVGTQLFGAEGSFGNGAAMRVAPVGVFYHDRENELRNCTELSASITHTHPLGKEGAALLAHAVMASGSRARRDRACSIGRAERPHNPGRAVLSSFSSPKDSIPSSKRRR